MPVADDKRDKVIGRIQALLAKVAPDSGATEGERDAAQRKVADLMTRYSVDMLDVDDADRGSIDDESADVHGMTEKWRGELRGRILTALGGDWFYTRWSRTRTRYTYVGRPEQLQVARALAEHLEPWLEIECEAALTKALADGLRGTCSRCDGEGWTRRLKGGGYSDDEHECPTCLGTGSVPLNRRVFRREFYDAANRRIRGRLAAQRRATANEAGGKGTELVRSDKAAVERYYEQQGIELRSVSSSSAGGAWAGRAAGAEAGERASLSPGGRVDGGRGALPKGAS